MPVAALAAGQKADLVLLEASPFRDMRALRKILAVVKGDAVLHATAGDRAPRDKSRRRASAAHDLSA